MMKTLFICFAFLVFLPDSSRAGEPKSRIRSGHNLLSEQSSDQTLVGKIVSEFAFNDLDGKPHYLNETLRDGPALFVFMSTKCPLAKRYTHRLHQIHQSYSPEGLRVFAVFSNSDDNRDAIEEFQSEVKYPFAVVADSNGYIAKKLGATMTPQTFLIDQFGILRYRGAIDDNRYENRVKQKYLTDALDSLYSGQSIAKKSVESMGCRIHLDKTPVEGEVTYASHIARILQDNCQNCHREDQVAPFALTNYKEAFRWREEIQAYSHSRLMPPWNADSEFAEYKNDMSLSQQEIDLIVRWVEDGAPLGDPSQVPPSPRFNDGWAFGEPDLIIEMQQEYIIGPEGEDDYRHFIIPFKADEHRFVKAVDVRPGNRNVVHHVLAYTDKSGTARKLDVEDDGPGYSRFGGLGFEPASVIGGWAPGNFPRLSPAGTGRWLPKECDIVMQVHYYRTGVEERDKTKLGIYFAKDDEPVPARMAVAINREFVIPKDATNYEVTAETTIEEDSFLFNVTPHMHLVGETMVVEAHRPDGTIVPIVKIDDWDFNWQNTYQFAEMQHLPKETVIKLRATFDNSEDNPNNPNSPPQPIGWGEKTTDEMCIAFLGILRQSEYDPFTQSRRKQSEDVEDSSVTQVFE